MINHVNNMLRHLFIAQITELTAEDRVRFQPPDEAWRGHVSDLGTGMALNIYLADLRENRKLRSNARKRQVQNGMVTETPAPRRIDCHYLITAWSPAEAADQVEPTLDEQALLYEVTGVSMNHDPLVPRQVYAPDPLPSTFPEDIADTELPTTILPPEGFPKLAEFWGAMGQGARWKPAIYLIVTLPVILRAEIAGPMVTTRITEYRQGGQSETAEVRIQIGGRVLDQIHPLDSGDPAPVPNAWVALEEAATGKQLQTSETDKFGRFTFGALRPGTYHLWARATGLGEIRQDIEVPSPTGEYDLKFE